MQTIESRNNPRLKRVRRILKGEEKSHFILEGKRLLEEVLDSGISIEEIYAEDAFWKREEKLLSGFKTDIWIVPPQVLRSVSDVKTPQGVVAVARKPEWGSIRVPSEFAALLYEIRDPGNLGTLVRGAEAAGCDFMVLAGDCADPFQPKVVRASMGSIFRVPLFQTRNLSDYLAQCRESGCHLYGLFPKGKENLFETIPEYPALLLIGSETSGLPENIPLEKKLWIPMKGKVESINAAMAGVISLYYFLRKQS
jgi:TrmH family RNA methyltransferase